MAVEMARVMVPVAVLPEVKVRVMAVSAGSETVVVS